MQEPLKLDIVISFPDHGFHLRFDPWSQVFLHYILFLYLSVLLLGYSVIIDGVSPLSHLIAL